MHSSAISTCIWASPDRMSSPVASARSSLSEGSSSTIRLIASKTFSSSPRALAPTATAHDPKDAQPAGVRVHVGLEHVGREGSFRIARNLFALFRDENCEGSRSEPTAPTLQVGRAWGATGYHVEQAVYADHALRARREDGDDQALGYPLADPVESLFGGDLLPF